MALDWFIGIDEILTDLFTTSTISITRLILFFLLLPSIYYFPLLITPTLITSIGISFFSVMGTKAEHLSPVII